MTTLEQQMPVEHVVMESTQPFEHVIEAFESQIGRTEPDIYQRIFASSRSLEVFTHDVEQILGPSGFMEFFAIDHGRWFSPYFHPLKAKLYVIGNPLVAQHFLKFAPETGLYVPIRVLVYENGQGKACISYDRPSELLKVGSVTDKEFIDTAKKLDQMTMDLVQKAIA